METLSGTSIACSFSFTYIINLGFFIVQEVQAPSHSKEPTELYLFLLIESAELSRVIKSERLALTVPAPVRRSSFVREDIATNLLC